LSTRRRPCLNVSAATRYGYGLATDLALFDVEIPLGLRTDLHRKALLGDDIPTPE
jgi:hypothetical protein